MKHFVAKLLFLASLRVIMVMSIGCVFLPPDYQNPHALADTFLLAIGGIVWGYADIALSVIMERP